MSVAGTSIHCNLQQQQASFISLRRNLRASFVTHSKDLAFLEFRSNAETGRAIRFSTPISSAAESIQVEAANVHTLQRGRPKNDGNLLKLWGGLHVTQGRMLNGFKESNKSSNCARKRTMSKVDCQHSEHSNSDQIAHKLSDLKTLDLEAGTGLSDETKFSLNGQKNTNDMFAGDGSCGNASDLTKDEHAVIKDMPKSRKCIGSETVARQAKVAKMHRSPAADCQSRQHIDESLVFQSGSDLKTELESDPKEITELEMKGKDSAINPKSGIRVSKSASMISSTSNREPKGSTDSEHVTSRRQVHDRLQLSDDSSAKSLEVTSEYKADSRSIGGHFEAESAEREIAGNGKNKERGVNARGTENPNRPEIEKERDSEFDEKEAGGFKFQQKRKASEAHTYKNVGNSADDDYPWVVEEEDPDWPDEGEEGWGFRLDSFFSDIKIKNDKEDKQGDDDDSDDESDIDLEEEDDDEWLVKGITSMEWEEIAFDPQPLVVLMYTRYGYGWSTNWSTLQELEKSIKFLWESRKFALRAVKVDGKMDKDLASALKVKEFPSLLFIKGGQLHHQSPGRVSSLCKFATLKV
ncbi:hypothetical protein O6H91_01G158100 [Diphasiastrum complanatum]|uniref:Uncharacterized protein n=1 Tax=Diphasiastrum complanatum TaxID=34168 RepID=A0ACC2EXN8_DIPCM|nr:hypothetical protein O6H91_01G158100 [Diphasiastrum complanatum]